jgi:hypothetical protein
LFRTPNKLMTTHLSFNKDEEESSSESEEEKMPLQGRGKLNDVQDDSPHQELMSTKGKAEPIIIEARHWKTPSGVSRNPHHRKETPQAQEGNVSSFMKSSLLCTPAEP